MTTGTLIIVLLVVLLLGVLFGYALGMSKEYGIGGCKQNIPDTSGSSTHKLFKQLSKK